MADEKTLKKLKSKYIKKLEGSLGNELNKDEKERYSEDSNLMQSAAYSKEYEDFKKELMPKTFSLYESLAKQTEKIFKIKPQAKEYEELKKHIDISHLEISPEGALSFAILVTLALTVLGIFLSVGVATLLFEKMSTFFLLFFIAGSLFVFFYLKRLPVYIASSLRLKASNNMVLCIFYVVTYMRHTSNLELAIKFASDYLTGPIALDLKKVLWDVETEKYDTIKDSLDAYLESWQDWNPEFVESFHLIESSLYEGSEKTRIDTLEKALDVILSETYDKMLHYAHNLKSPITMLHMLGIILPILGLVILPLAVNFIEGVKWFHIAILYNVTIPIVVYLLGKNILSTRPTGYGEVDIAEEIPEFKKYHNLNLSILGKSVSFSSIYTCIIIAIIFMLIGLSPVIIHLAGVQEAGSTTFSILGYVYDSNVGKLVGPFGLGAALLSLFFPLTIGISLGIYYYTRTKDIIKIRSQTKKLEDEFASGIFQLGNRLGDGAPAEVAFGKTAVVTKGTQVGSFFLTVSNNIQGMGMSVQDAIFNSKTGAIKLFPSSIIISSMKVLVQSIKKSPQISANALMNISRYIKEINRVNERLKDLLADILSSMSSQINFMAPVIAGIVVGITSMISNILGKLSPLLEQQEAVEGFSGFDTDIFGLGIPTYYFQAIVGIYVVQIIYILTIMYNGIENGEDKLNEQYLLGKYLLRSTLTYVIVTAIVMIFFNLVADSVIGGLLPEVA